MNFVGILEENKTKDDFYQKNKNLNKFMKKILNNKFFYVFNFQDFFYDIKLEICNWKKNINIHRKIMYMVPRIILIRVRRCRQYTEEYDYSNFLKSLEENKTFRKFITFKI